MELNTHTQSIPNPEALLGFLEKVAPSELKAIDPDSAVEIAEVLETLPWARYAFASYIRQNHPEIGGWIALLPELEAGVGA